jgi:cyclic beta-1,2-glucan synthetase
VCDNAFASQLLYRLRESSVGAHDEIEWIEGQLENLGSNAEEVLIIEHNRLSSANVRIGNIVRSLGIINGTDWAKWFTQVSRVDALLQDRSNFNKLDFNSQDSYRNVIELLARNSTVTELQVTGTALDLFDQERNQLSSGVKCRSPDIGQYFIGDKRTELEKAIKCRVLLRTRIARAYRKLGWLSVALPIIGLTALVIATVFGFLMTVGLEERTAIILSLLAALPASEAATGLFNTLVTFIKAPTRLVGFKYKDGIPEIAKTLVVIPCLISSRDEVDDLIRNLEVHYLSNARGEIYFALASDWGDSETEISAADEEVLSYARKEMDHLAAKYVQNDKTRFFLLHRKRLFNPSEGIWMGWERKRGKLHELNLLLRGDHDTTFLSTDPGLPTDIQYVMTLDADTRITREAVTKLVGKMAHPLNQPFIDEEKGRVVSGYAIMQPRVTPSLTTGEEASAFQRIFSQNRGLDPYVFAVSDVYQDLTGEGTFTGKGLYQVDAFNTVLKDQHADNTILSHDLLESTLARSALVTDVELIEDFPVRYEVECARQHRWARGDWQLLPYIYNLKNGIPALGRWKMFDNLRRTMVPGAWLIASLLGWCVMSLPVAILWQAFLVLSLFISPTLSLIRNIFPGKIQIVPQTHLYAFFSDAMSATVQVLLRIKRHLLEWRTAAQIQAASHPTFLGYYRFMQWALFISMLGVIAVFISGGVTALVALLFSFFWASSPFFAWLVSKTAETEDRLEVSVSDRTVLRKIARRTWQYFEQFVTERLHGEHGNILSSLSQKNTITSHPTTFKKTRFLWLPIEPHRQISACIYYQSFLPEILPGSV